MEELYNHIMDNKWNQRQINDGYRLSFLVLCEYKKKSVHEKKQLLSKYVIPNIGDIIISYLRLVMQPTFDGSVVYESPDEKQVHDHALIQIEAWNEMRNTADNIYPKLFIDDINYLANYNHRTLVHYNDLDIFIDANISIIVHDNRYYNGKFVGRLSLFNYNTKYTLPIVGFGHILDDPSSILILVSEWCNIRNHRYGRLYKQNSYLTKIQNLYEQDWQKILDMFNYIGVFYVTR